ncbi:MAG: hypothetical protein ACK4WH_14855 [Phycisphaerales bacterium]
MKKFVLSSLVLAALAGTAVAQPVRMELRLVRQDGTPPGTVTDIDIDSSVTANPGDVLRFEMQYRILDLDLNDDIFPAGLTAATIDITSSTGTLLRGQLSRFEAQLAGALNPPTSTDSSGLPSGSASGRQGLHSPFRGGLSNANNNDLPSNGVSNVDINPDPALYTPGPGNTLLSVTPLAISQHNQGNPDVGSDNEWWFGLYTFTYTVGNSNDVINANNVADPQTFNSFGYFSDGLAVPLTSGNSVGASYRIIGPAPGSVALLGLGGLLVARRRRA